MLKKFLFFIAMILTIIGVGFFYLRNNPYQAYNKSPDDPVQLGALDQNWSEAKRAFWYGASQGSRLIPLAWLEALEKPGAIDLFMAPEHVKKFNLIPRKVDVPDRKAHAQLALGFVIDKSSDQYLERTKLRWKNDQNNNEAWVGLNCSACHTSQIKYQGKDIRIDGGASLFDFQVFMETLNTALEQTYSDKVKWDRFAQRVLSDENSNSDNKDKLRKAFKKLLDWQKKEAEVNKTSIRYGYGRIDAFGHIFNKVGLLVNDEAQSFVRSDAPVSTPFVWSAPQYNKVQYNGAAPRIIFGGIDVGAIGRNVGEVIGVFGDITLNENLDIDGFNSSIHLKNLYNLEEVLRDLRSPKWPTEIFGPFTKEEREKEAVQIERGRHLYNQNCLYCHDVVDRTDTKSNIVVQDNYFIEAADIAPERAKNLPPYAKTKKIEPIRTDPWMACNAYSYSLKTGLWSSKNPRSIDFESIGNGDQLMLGQSVKASKLLAITVAGVMAANKQNVAELIGNNFLKMPHIPSGLSTLQDGPIIDLDESWKNVFRNEEKTLRLAECEKACRAFSHSQMKEENNVLGYTSRPLNGIWASAPYLHNGSIPTLYDLLLPENERPKTFWMGSLEFDPEKVGYVTKQSLNNNFLFKVGNKKANGYELIDGNLNSGHDYDNKKFTHADRMALIAYLKTL